MPATYNNHTKPGGDCRRPDAGAEHVPQNAVLSHPMLVAALTRHSSLAQAATVARRLVGGLARYGAVRYANGHVACAVLREDQDWMRPELERRGVATARG